MIAGLTADDANRLHALPRQGRKILRGPHLRSLLLLPGLEEQPLQLSDDRAAYLCGGVARGTWSSFPGSGTAEYDAGFSTQYFRSRGLCWLTITASLITVHIMPEQHHRQIKMQQDDDDDGGDGVDEEPT